MRIKSSKKKDFKFRNHLTRFEYWIFKKILKKLVLKRNQIWLYDQIYQASREVYFEDNFFDHSSTMQYCMNAAIANNDPRGPYSS